MTAFDENEIYANAEISTDKSDENAVKNNADAAEAGTVAEETKAAADTQTLEASAGSGADIEPKKDKKKLTEKVPEVEFVPIRVKGGRGYAICKRAFDIVSSASALLVLGVPMLVVGILVKATSKGPMLYVSTRVGKNGRLFKFYKFRSMVADAEQLKEALMTQNEVEGGVTFKMKNDPRITKFGKFIRKFSIDELPQLFNILKGDMSVIGPRAGLPEEFEKMNEYQKQRVLVPQGLSGEWQVRGRSDTTFDEMIELDLEYISKKRSFRHDIKLIFGTVGVVLSGKGAE